MTPSTKPRITSYKQFYTSPWGIAFIAYFVAMGLVGALTPADILKSNPWAREFCDFMANIVPQIDAVTKLNIAPDINRFYFSVMWAGSPIVCTYLCTLFWLKRHTYLSNRNTVWMMPLIKIFKRLLLPLVFFIAAYYFFYYATDSTSKVLRFLLGTYLGRVFSQAFVLAPVFATSSVLLIISGWLTGYIPRNIKYQNELEQNNGRR